MFRSRSSAPGSAPATLVPRSPDAGAQRTTLRLLEFNQETLEDRILADVSELPPAGLDDGKVRWLDVAGLADVEVLQTLGQRYGLHPLALEDVLNMGQRPKVEAYAGHLFIVMDMVYYDREERLCGEQVSMFLCPGLLITIQEEVEFDVFDPVRARIRSGRGNLRKSGADYLAYALIDSIIDHYFPVLEHFGDDLQQLEERVLAKPDPSCVSQIQSNKRTLLHLRRCVWPSRDVVSALLHDEENHIRPGTQVFLRDCHDHAIRVMDLLEAHRDVNSGLMDLYLSTVSQKTNEIMRVLTVISSIFIPLSFVAGFYGMNFDSANGEMPLNMPELHKPYGYLLCVLVMLGIASLQIAFFRRKKWL
jgi:magnesium transporter